MVLVRKFAHKILAQWQEQDDQQPTALFRPQYNDLC